MIAWPVVAALIVVAYIAGIASFVILDAFSEQNALNKRERGP